MQIQCPYCQHHMSAKTVMVGRFRPKCSQCGKPFLLTVEAGGKFSVQALGKKDLSRETEETRLDQHSTKADTPDQPASPSKASQPPTKPSEPRKSGTAAARKAAAESPIDATIPSEFEDSGKSQGSPPGGTSSVDRERRTRPAGRDPTMVGDPAASPSRGGPGASLPAPATRPEARDSTAVGAESLSHAGANLRLGGYRILKELGRGAMGSVYLARQLSLDRQVALKTIQARWASNPKLVARFMREAYAAAQLTHHNVVQIYDLGNERGINFFSMELVRGQSLAEYVKAHGKLDCYTAAGFILQAARGLDFAHRQGMVHRDIKPANLMINEEGVVKVADLGLVKIPGGRDDEGPEFAEDAELMSHLSHASADITHAHMAVGTPAYIAPEQAEDSSQVDHRADIYSLGCTLYALVSGRPPFKGESAIDVITKHRTEPMKPLHHAVDGVPRELSDIVGRMTAKNVDERYGDLRELIADLEELLKSRPGQTSGPSEEQAQSLENSIRRFNAVGLARARPWIVAAVPAGCALLAVMALLISPGVGLGFLWMGLAAAAGYFVANGWRERSPLFDHVRRWCFASSWSDWLTALGAVLLFLTAGLLFGFLLVWLVMILFGLGSGIALAVILDRRVNAERQAALDSLQHVLKSLRLQGMAETEVRSFVAQFGGKDWEEVFESLFGYEAKLEARRALIDADLARGKSRFRVWREPIIAGLRRRLATQREARDIERLKRIELAGLRAEGVAAEQAESQAEQLAAAVLNHAQQIRSAPALGAESAVDPRQAAEAKRERIKAMLADARSGKYSRRGIGARWAAGPIGLALGGKVRFLAGALLLAGCLLWAHQNEIVSGRQVRQAADAAQQAIEGQDASDADADPLVTIDTDRELQPLRLPGAGLLFDSFNPGVAGLILLLSALWGGWKLSLFMYPAAAVTVGGHLAGIPEIIAIYGLHSTSLAAGLMLAAVGVVAAFLGHR